MSMNGATNAATNNGVRYRVSQGLIRQSLRIFVGLYRGVLSLLTTFGPRRRSSDAEGVRILLTGTFYADNWALAHLRPLASAPQCASLCVVSTWPIPTIEKVTAIYPPRWLSRIVGLVAARLLTFFWVGIRTRPHVIGGFHLLLNGLLALLLARLIGARAMYFSVGGPPEMLGGGVTSENRLFEKLRTPDLVLERQLLNIVSRFDTVITMGKRAISIFRQYGVETDFHVVSGGIDTSRFYVTSEPPRADLILVARLVPIKRIDLFLEVIRQVRETLPKVSAIIVGDGPLRQELEQKAAGLHLSENVKFVGYHRDVEVWLRQAKLFILTSQSEGLALSLMEAMLCGLPAVVPNVGDLGELVTEGVNGHLVEEHTPEAFAARILSLLTDSERYQRFAKAARTSSERYEISAVVRLWNAILKNEATTPMNMATSYTRG
jgi:L-malate glycosyltransferase